MAAAPKVNFSTCYENFRHIMSDITDKRLKKIYLLMGEEPYFVDRITDRIAKTVLSPEEQEFNQSIVYGAEVQIGDIVALACQYPVMSKNSVIIVKDAQKLKQIDMLQQYLKQPLDTTILVLSFRGENIDKRSAVYKRCAENGVVFESLRPRDYEISTWLTELLRGKGKNIDAKASSMLVDFLGTDLKKIDNEINKLITRIDQQVKEITPDHIEQNIGISKDFNNFELTKALSDRDMGKALLIAEHFANNPKDNPLVVTIQTIFTHFTRIFSLGIIIWNSKKKRQQMPDDMTLMRELKLSNVYFLREYKQAVSTFNTSTSFKILGIIREYDMKSKGMGTGSANDGELLRELIFKIFSA